MLTRRILAGLGIVLTGLLAFVVSWLLTGYFADDPSDQGNPPIGALVIHAVPPPPAWPDPEQTPDQGGKQAGTGNSTSPLETDVSEPEPEAEETPISPTEPTPEPTPPPPKPPPKSEGSGTGGNGGSGGGEWETSGKAGG